MGLACRVAVLSAFFILLSKPLLASGDGGSGLVTSVGIAIIAATVMSFLGHMGCSPKT